MFSPLVYSYHLTIIHFPFLYIKNKQENGNSDIGGMNIVMREYRLILKYLCYVMIKLNIGGVASHGLAIAN